MHEELVKMLRVCGDSNNSCGNCPIRENDGGCPHGDWEFAAEKYMLQAADAIEDLSSTVNAQRDILMAYGGETGIKQMEEYAGKYWDTLAKIPRWIPVTERLPKGADKSGELCENVWLFFDGGNVYPGWMNGITEKVYYLDNYNGSLMTAQKSRVKMWQPRPEPPKEEK